MITVRKPRIWCFALLIIIAAGMFSWVPGVSAQEETTRKVKKQVKPQYPVLASQLKLSGIVKVAVVVAPDGKVTSARAVGGHPVLVDAAVDAANHWEFEASSKETSQTLEFKFDRENH
jgi:TonB family protein